jgi:hypothetical protein
MPTKTLLSFENEQTRRGAYSRSDRGVEVVDVERIVGSVGRARELDGRFRYRSRHWLGVPRGSSSRFNRLRRLFDEGRVPPLELYQIGDDLYVLDGHHRTALALERGQQYLDAHIVEFLPDRSDPANAVYHERATFVRATGLRDVHATEPGRYPRLLNRVQDHRHELERAHRRTRQPTGEQLLFGIPSPTRWKGDLRAAARDWHEREYRPVVEVLEAERIDQRFPGRGLGDLYGYVCDHRWFLGERRGDLGLDVALTDFVQRHRPEPLAEAVLDPIAALGSEVLEAAGPRGWGALGAWIEHDALVLAAGLVSLPLAFLRGLRPAHYRYPRLSP